MNRKLIAKEEPGSLIYSFILVNKQIQALHSAFYVPGNVPGSVGCFVVQRWIQHMYEYFEEVLNPHNIIEWERGYRGAYGQMGTVVSSKIDHEKH